jgi:hypothetical protein
MHQWLSGVNDLVDVVDLKDRLDMSLRRRHLLFVHCIIYLQCGATKASPEPNLRGDTVKYPKTNAYSAPEDGNRSHFALFSCGLWLRIGAIGAFGLMGVLHQLFNGEMQPLSALSLAAGSCVLIAMSWWRARVVLDRDDETVPATAALAKVPASLSANTAVSGSVA